MEKNQKVEAAMQKVESHQSDLAAKDHLIQNLHQDLYQVEPEREKIEQTQQQDNILVQIQITLDG